MSADAHASGPGSAAPAPARQDGPGTDNHRRGWLVVGLVVAVALLIGSVAGTIASARADLGSGLGGVDRSGRSTSGLGGHGYGPGMMGGRVSTDVPALPGTTVQVTAVDMGAMMGGVTRMRLVTDGASVRAGTVSLVLRNAGFRTHELVVLPLTDGQQAGDRPVGADETVDEDGSLGEASQTGGPGIGDGIEPGTAGWTSVDLPAGRYELICNLPGHYAAGMYTELTVR